MLGAVGRMDGLRTECQSKCSDVAQAFEQSFGDWVSELHVRLSHDV